MSAGTVTLTETEQRTPGGPPISHIFRGSDGEFARVLGRRVRAYCGIWVTPPPVVRTVIKIQPHHCQACAAIVRSWRAS